MQPDPVHLRPCSDQADLLGESPLWVAASQTLYWVDIAGRALRARSAEGVESRWDFDEEPGCIAPASDGSLLVALRSQLLLFDPRDGSRRRLCGVPWDPATTRSNDGRCDPQGRFWVGTVFEPKTAAQAGLYCLRRSGAGWSLERELGDSITANGLAFSPDGKRAWWSNTPEHLIRGYDFDGHTGRLSEPREFRRFPTRSEGHPYGGRPDGAAVDSSGAYWVAMYEGARVLCLDAGGATRLELPMPVLFPTMVCLGGPAWRTLFVTTAAKGLAPEALARAPLSGRVLAIELDALEVPPEVHGLPPAVFDLQGWQASAG